ncbi:isoprenoid synthase domain-containing protein [Colletotrichum navitas]|uniref:Isoprenoid synthase domain-containing protein n=1 Tax=Colletotrichum navitas TaxID=681940 RepID=A0AAD8PWM5_9PEZI|nr:isoprenoid synthase domain-containing protein [Colletotrichum navitas]KAK1585168.1 isoprenoid synthase domain-containing protein [Colletotrichum navitas]
MAVTQTESAQLASQLDGRVIIIPDLRRMLSHWPSGRNVHAPDIEVLINGLLDKDNAPAQDIANVREANPTLLASSLWPNVSKGKLGTLTLMVLWQGRLDDYIEALEYKSQAKAKEFRSNAKGYIAHYLQLSEGPTEPAMTPIISDFQPVAKMVCQQYDEDQRRKLKASLFEYIDSTVQEMRYIDSGEVPTDLKYDMLRKKTAGTGPLCALAEFASGLEWPSTVFNSHPFKMMLQSVAIVVGLTNDLLSLRKELRKGRTLSVVPVRLWNNPDGDLEAVVGEVVDDIEKAVRQFDICERRLINQSQADSDATRQIAATLKTIFSHPVGTVSANQLLMGV